MTKVSDISWNSKKKKARYLLIILAMGPWVGDRSLRFTGQQAYLTDSESTVLRNTVGFHSWSESSIWDCLLAKPHIHAHTHMDKIYIYSSITDLGTNPTHSWALWTSCSFNKYLQSVFRYKVRTQEYIDVKGSHGSCSLGKLPRSWNIAK